MRYLILCLLLVGCSSTAVFTSPDGKVWKAKVNGLAKSEMKTEGLTMKIERKPLIEIPSVDDLKIGGED